MKLSTRYSITPAGLTALEETIEIDENVTACTECGRNDTYLNPHYGDRCLDCIRIAIPHLLDPDDA